jgi:hypothetical protein
MDVWAEVSRYRRGKEVQARGTSSVSPEEEQSMAYSRKGKKLSVARGGAE